MEASARILPQSQIVNEWWLEVKDKFWDQNAKEQVKKLLKNLMESTLNEELRDVIRRAPYQRGGLVHRNGHYQRSLVTQFGFIDGIRVPRLRQGSFKTQVFNRYKRHQGVVEDLIEGIFLAGVSTRRVGEALSKLLETNVSHGTVSNITKRLDRSVRQFHEKPLLDEYQYLFLDGVNLKIKHNLAYHNRKVLTVYGITVFGKKELIAFRQSPGESGDAWESLLRDLYRRGLKGQNLKLIVMDGAKGSHNACLMVYPLIPTQLCWAHKLRNVSNYCPKKHEAECMGQAKSIYSADNRHDALDNFKAWKERWMILCPKAVQCLQRDLDRLCYFYSCPKTHWRSVRTTNSIERSFREVRRRTRVFSCFSNEASCSRIIYAIFTHLNNNWKVMPIRKFTQFC